MTDVSTHVSAPGPLRAPPALEAHAGVARELRWFRAILGLCFLATLLLSWRLWLSSGRDYPLVPLVDGLPQPPYPLDWLLLGAMAAALAGMSFARRPRPYLAAVLGISLVWLVLDQTRLQPYVLTFLAGTACLLLGESRAVRAPGDPAARWYLAPYQLSLCAVYVYSGVHKLNVRFLEHSFSDWISPVARVLRIDLSAMPGLTFAGGVAAAAGEAALGLALLWPRTRRPAVVGLTLVHVYILLFLGLHGLRGNTVVWPWNVAVVASLWLLFWPRGTGARFDGFVRAWWRGRRGAATVPRPLRWTWGTAVVMFALLPALNFAELWYASLSFPLYAAKHRQVRIYYDPGQRAALPPAALRGTRPGGEVDLLWWSMRELNVAPVMETHVVTRIAREVARAAPRADVRLVIAGQSGVFSGERSYRTFVFRGSAQVPHEVATKGEIPDIGPRRKD